MFAKFIRFLLVAALVTVQTAVFGNERGGDSSGDGNLGRGNNHALNNSTTNRVIDILSRGIERCVRLPPIYRFDCYRSTYRQASEVLRGGMVYSEAYMALTGVEDTLRLVVRNNVDPSKKPIRRGLKTYKAIHEAAIPEAKARTERAMQQAETILLRAPDNKQAHFARIADAVNSNKVLLRSVLLLPGSLLRFAWYMMQLRPV